MKSLLRQRRTPVRREHGSQYLLLMLIAFAASITLTRLFLQLTGYPQLGGGTLHIAHVLWGGLLLFAASLLPLVLVNRWARIAGAGLAGAGAGLFLDEVGKFITSTNDYFYPPAAPIVYVFFLLTVWVYIQLSRPPANDPRASLYRVLEGLEEILDHDLDDDERADLVRRLLVVRGQERDADLARLAGALLIFLQSNSVVLAPRRPDFFQRLRARAKDFESRRLSQGVFRIGLAGGLAALGAYQVAGLARLLLALPAPQRLGNILAGWILDSHVSSLTALDWYAVRLGSEAVIGILLIISAALFVLGKKKGGVSLAVIGLLFSITAINPLVFYFDQFSTILPATIQFVWLLLVLHYQRRYAT